MKFMMVVTGKMEQRLKKEMDLRHSDSVQETIRAILGEYFKEKNQVE